MRIHFLSNSPWTSTGYGVQTKLFLHRIKALGHEVSCTDFYGLEGGILTDNHGIKHYPKGIGQGYGVDIVGANAQHAQADIVISLIDAWVLKPDMCPTAKWCPWFPVDSEPIPPPVARTVKNAFRPITYAKFGLEECEKAGIDAAYVPHGVDTSIYKPKGQKSAREALKWRDDLFIFGMIAANKGTPSRKSYPQHLESFANFCKSHDDAVLYVHCNCIQGQFDGVNLPELAQALGIGDKVLFPDQYGAHLGFDDDYMTNVYSAIDCLASVSMGEGFGVPILEAQACGTFVLTGDWTAMSELTWNGYALPKDGAEKFWTRQATYQFLPRIEALRGAFEVGYREARKWKGKVPAQVAEYDADYVTEHYWKPVLEDIERRLQMQGRMNAAVRVPGMAVAA